jgi:hypothetical protein
MGKKTKNPAQKLSYADKEILEKVVLTFALKFYALTQKYPNPKKYVENVVVKAIQSDETHAVANIIMYAKNDPSDDYSFIPREINQRLANDLLNSIQETVQEPGSSLEHKRFMHPRDLRKKVLKKLEDHGILLHLEGKEEFKKYKKYKTKKGKQVEYVGGRDRGGRPSLYIATEEFEKLKKTMNNTGALKFLYDKIIKTGIALKLFEYQSLAFLYTAKMDEQVAQRLMSIGASFFQSKVTENNSSKSSALHQMLQTMDDDQLEQYAHNIAKSLIEVRGFYSLLFLPGLLRL